ncbi:MAG: AMMECR1 domain-containing protein [Acidobacteria bacterium]|nr:MAG: AMMECR1 domain-containing protein [Acidobacteriota bacterium]
MSDREWDAGGDLSEREREELLAVARRAIEAHLSSAPLTLPDVAPALRRRGAVFVTLRSRGDDELRGCIGTLEPRESLVEAVARMAVAAATQDLRFASVSAVELPSITLEISVLTAPVPIAPQDVEPGVHGLIVRHAGRSGLLLPQVATDYGWDRETFLQYTCVKAGLPRDAWTDPAAILLAFTAEVFGED